VRWRDEGTGGSAEPEERTGYGRWERGRTRREDEGNPPARDEPGGPRPREGSAGPSGAEAEHICDMCGGTMIERHCKILCLQCGYQRDCSDP
jgi:hypothetical protein